MALVSTRYFSCLVAALLVFPLPSRAFETPLSDTAVREAYFLAQRHDAHCLEAYTKSFPTPAKGPHIAAVTFLTPFVQLVQQASTRVTNYSAQQAEADHRGAAEFVRITVLIHLTPSYPWLISPADASRSGIKPVFRPSDFWKDFQVSVFDDDRVLEPSDFHGRANWSCGSHGPCAMSGATLDLTIPATAFASDRAVVQVDPPEGDTVRVSFDLTSLR